MKKIIIILSILLFTGCSIEYNLKINDESLEEKTIVKGASDSIYNNYQNYHLLTSYSESRSLIDSMTEENYKNYNLYGIEDISKNNIKSLKFSNNFNLENYSDSNIIRSCYELVNVLTNENIITISTSNKFNCYELYDELETVTINITTDYKIVQSNADSVKGKTYTWKITRENYKNKPITLVYNKDEKVVTLFDYLKNNMYLTISILVFITILGIVIVVIKIKSNKVNKI